MGMISRGQYRTFPTNVGMISTAVLLLDAGEGCRVAVAMTTWVLLESVKGRMRFPATKVILSGASPVRATEAAIGRLRYIVGLNTSVGTWPLRPTTDPETRQTNRVHSSHRPFTPSPTQRPAAARTNDGDKE